MENRFKDLMKMHMPIWVVDLFVTNTADIDIRLQNSLTEMHSNQIVQAKFLPWASSEIMMKFPLLFPTSSVSQVLAKYPSY
uniref:Uncharacterized protein n=1 Tax=Octopus bimaculoides TaxID=37653 RepID=A0A0L8G0K3_OCTBM